MSPIRPTITGSGTFPTICRTCDVALTTLQPRMACGQARTGNGHTARPLHGEKPWCASRFVVPSERSQPRSSSWWGRLAGQSPALRLTRIPGSTGRRAARWERRHGEPRRLDHGLADRRHARQAAPLRVREPRGPRRRRRPGEQGVVATALAGTTTWADLATSGESVSLPGGRAGTLDISVDDLGDGKRVHVNLVVTRTAAQQSLAVSSAEPQGRAVVAQGRHGDRRGDPLAVGRLDRPHDEQGLPRERRRPCATPRRRRHRAALRRRQGGGRHPRRDAEQHRLHRQGPRVREGQRPEQRRRPRLRRGRHRRRRARRGRLARRPRVGGARPDRLAVRPRHRGLRVRHPEHRRRHEQPCRE